MINVAQTIISQYANSPTLVQLIENTNLYLDPSANIDAFYELVWNVETAQGYGLDIWGRIVGVSRVLQVANDLMFGFENDISNPATFNQGTFYSGGPSSGNYALSDPAFRLLILAKAASNISDCSIPSINGILMALFPNRGNAYVTDGADMTMTYTFDFNLTAVESAIVAQSGVLPKPTGVSATVV